MHEEGYGGRKAVWGRAGWLVVVAAALASMPACGKVSDSGTSPSYLMIDNLRGASGATPTAFSNTLSSDVSTKGGIYTDPGAVTLRLGLKDPGSPSAPNTPTLTNYITVTHYRVVYTRTDGRNTAGVDVPYPIEGGMSLTAIGGTTSGNFDLVRAQAKIEPPLAALVGMGGAIIISTTAEVTFYGYDQAGNAVSVTGYISVAFADWADPA